MIRPAGTLALVLAAGTAAAHDPIFGLGPHVLFRGGIETAVHIEAAEAGDERPREVSLDLVYGLTGDWAVGIELPWEEAGGAADPVIFTKYRFWRRDSLGLQESAAVLLALEPDTGASRGTGSTDATLGIAWGHESRRWYRWASLRWRRNGTDDNGVRRGERILLDLVLGVRLRPTGYREPDTVWMVELNGVRAGQARRLHAPLADTGGTEWFLSPGVFWTRRNFAIKGGVQIPVASDLRGDQQATDYRARLVFEWHL